MGINVPTVYIDLFKYVVFFLAVFNASSAHVNSI